MKLLITFEKPIGSMLFSDLDRLEFCAIMDIHDEVITTSRRPSELRFWADEVSDELEEGNRLFLMRGSHLPREISKMTVVE